MRILLVLNTRYILDLLLGSALVFVFLYINISYVEAQDVQQQVQTQRAVLENELAQIEKDIEIQKKILQEKQRQGASVERDVAILNAEIEKAKLVIRAKNIAINGLNSEIGVKNKTIAALSDKIDKGRESLAQLIRSKNEIENFSIIEVVLANKNLSEFFIDLDAIDTINLAMSESFTIVRDSKDQAEKEKIDLAKKKAAEADARATKEAEKRAVEINENEKKVILNAIKKEEKTYQQIVNDRERRAAEIRSALFALRDSAPIPFGEALDYATSASIKTGVRPAFVLAILTQESNLGENIGLCYLTNFDTGAGKGKNTGRVFEYVMKSDRDVKPFLDIMKRLGLAPDKTPVSCPWSGGGYGGAMGPSQFIPSTWILYESKISRITGNNPPSPWNPKDAITATSIYLSELGADIGGYTAEREAALRYYAGGNWNKASNAFYADGNSYSPGVMKLAQKIQETMIDPLQKY